MTSRRGDRPAQGDGRRRWPLVRRADRVDEAMATVGRAAFLPADQQARARRDEPLPLWHGQTSSQPSTVAAMLRLLDVPPGARVLDVGAGSGWTTALLAHLVGSQGWVAGVELDPELAAWGAQNLAATAQPWACLVPADPGVLGLPGSAPFERILVSADAPALPSALVAQLGEGGRMVLPVRGQMLLVAREPNPAAASGDDVVVTRHGAYRFVPLL